MRIISKYHDYYDSVMRQGMDKECVYLREPKEIKLETEYRHWHDRSDKGNLNLIYTKTYSQIDERFDSFIIGFCGKIYPCNGYEDIRNGTKTFSYVKEPLKNERTIFHSVDFFDRDWSDFEKYFTEYKVPIFVIRFVPLGQGLTLILNDSLRQYEFFKIKDSYTAYQEIYQYISGVLGVNNHPMVEISDKSKIEKRGFDKWSFRKQPKEIK